MKKIFALLALVLLVSGAVFTVYNYNLNSQKMVHTVVKGESLSKIAKQYSVTVEDLKQWNGLTSDMIEVDQTLVVGTKVKDQPQVAKKKAKKDEVPQLHKMGMKSGSRSLPKAKKCLGGPDMDSLEGERGMRTNKGLSSNQISQSMNNFFPQLSDCMPDEWPTASIEIDFNVGCNGRVDYVRIIKDDDLDFGIQGCIEESFKYAEFPAHDLPDGMDFTYPIEFQPG